MGNLVKETPYSEITATLEALDSLGITREHLRELRKDKGYIVNVASFINSGGILESDSQREARRTLGETNFFGAPEWSKYLGFRFTNRELRKIVKFPWPEEVLNSPCPFFKGKLIHETHFAYLGLKVFDHRYLKKSYPLTIKVWESYSPDVKINFSHELFQGGRHIFEDETCDFRWYLMPKHGVPKLEGVNFQNQQEILPPQYEIPRAIKETTKHLLYYRKNKEYINVFKNEHDSVAVRCRNIVIDERSRGFISYVSFRHSWATYKGNCFSICIPNSPESLNLAASRIPGQ